ncbi:hypothetical protein [Xenorhabdus griffiniae]|uniref:Uncharacterized protein n=1 Tax=Xenorhabdus griffiniae TaxID=351672 RepID=A0ABY9XFQ4_9GAMM|nr:hypothetical protein [Xenorhabdus griffiniae]MBD1229525.1 hypothetical protein [Xenorhabdus griffiniae]MBE8589349.1 hypothetical protein [Xenorhabdus griffiniae]WMV71667.1 hypothetical protein QL128_16225 [Xenorhabdus griffiniae]WNH01344.1 hypothetical protein QL112_016230 [Xenorhabdus griffiniae]
MSERQVKLSRIFKGGSFMGYALSVDGLLLSNQQNVTVETKAKDIHPILTVTFAVTNEMADEATDIYI